MAKLPWLPRLPISKNLQRTDHSTRSKHSWL
jgi:hypothetical protein